MSAMTLLGDLVLARLKQRLADAYGDRLVRVILYGSRARGDWNDESDYDIAVFLTNIRGLWADSVPLADLGVELFDLTGQYFDLKPYLASEWAARTTIMGEIRRDGIEI